MKHLINQRVQNIQISGIRKFSNLASQYKDAISLTIGQPDFPTPDHIKEAGKKAIDGNKTTYTHNAGLLELRKAASDYLQKKYGLAYDPATEILVTHGATEAIDITFRTILEEDTEVILPGPTYAGYEPVVRLCGAKPVFVDTTGTGFKLNAKLLQEKLTDKTRCVILPYPSNPTGCVLGEKELTEIAELLQDKDIFVISDEIYSELIYDGSHQSIASFPALREKTIVINGLSKSHSMTGWRIGLTFAPQYIAEQMIKVHQYNVTCASSISQHAAIEALTKGINDGDQMRTEYKKRRDYIYNRLTGMGLETEKPAGAFYIFPSIKKFNMKSFDFAVKLLEEQKVAVVPGDAFSSLGEGYIRISYACSMELLEEAMNRMERFVESLEG